MDEAKRIAIERWLIKAGNDLRTAETMLNVQAPTTDTVCFHTQQCVEKSLKAFLVYKDKHVEKTHYLPHLIELCSQLDPAFQSLKDIAIELTDYAVTDRYPENWRDIPVEEASAAVTKATHILEFVREKLRVV